LRIWVEPMLGRLARWLRLLGHDAPLRRGDWPRLLPGEALITRRRALAGRPGVVFVTSDHLEEQLAQVMAELGLKLEPAHLFTRCLDCNQPVEPASREQVQGLVPEYILHTAEAFSRCPACGKIYWPGSHGRRALALLERLSPPPAR